MKFIIKGDIGNVRCREVDENLLSQFSPADYSELHGIKCNEVFSDYFDDKFAGVTGGKMEFRFEKGGLYNFTTYNIENVLDKDTALALVQYTMGQWSDGIGENFEQHPCLDTNAFMEIYLSPWHENQVVTYFDGENWHEYNDL